MKKQLLLFVLMLLPMMASADESGSCGENLTWTFVESTGTLTISGSGAMTEYKSENTPWYSFKNKISKAVIKTGVTSIGSSAFAYCGGLTAITIPESVTSIGTYAFGCCKSLTSITLPTKITSISNSLFSDCSSLTSITIPESVTSIDDSAFDCCSALTSLTIPDGVTFLGSYAFNGCKSLTSFVIGNNITEIRYRAFYGCTNITSLIVGKNVETIGRDAFMKCSNLTSITIPNNVKLIDDYAFQNCTNLNNLIIRANEISIRTKAFDLCRLHRIFITGLQTSVSSNAFTDRTYQHAQLYIPAGTWIQVVYDSNLYKFNNILEMAANTQQLTCKQAYTLMNANTYNFAVYDAVNNKVRQDYTDFNIDESNPNNCWQIIDNNGKKAIYNLGAHKFLKISNNDMLLQNNPVYYDMTNVNNGMQIGSDTFNQWTFVVNRYISADENVTAIDYQNVDNSNINTIFTIDGKRVDTPRKGLNIIRMSDGSTKKVVIK